MLPCTQKIADLPWKHKGVILSGSPYSVYDAEAPHVDPTVFDLDVRDCSVKIAKRGVEDPKKRKIIGNTFVDVFQREAERVVRESGGDVDFLLQGTLYPDVIESISFKLALPSRPTTTLAASSRT